MMYLHDQHVIHCDLAVRNLLVTTGDSDDKYLVKVNDFGLSKIIANSDVYTKADQSTVKIDSL